MVAQPFRSRAFPYRFRLPADATRLRFDCLNSRYNLFKPSRTGDRVIVQVGNIFPLCGSPAGVASMREAEPRFIKITDRRDRGELLELGPSWCPSSNYQRRGFHIVLVEGSAPSGSNRFPQVTGAIVSADDCRDDRLAHRFRINGLRRHGVAMLECVRQGCASPSLGPSVQQGTVLRRSVVNHQDGDRAIRPLDAAYQAN